MNQSHDAEKRRGWEVTTHLFGNHPPLGSPRDNHNNHRQRINAAMSEGPFKKSTGKWEIQPTVKS